MLTFDFDPDRPTREYLINYFIIKYKKWTYIMSVY